MKALKRIALALVATIVLALVVVAFLGATETGTALLVRTLSPLVPDGIDTGRVSGRLFGPLRLENATIDTASATVAIGSLALDWRPTALVSRNLDIEWVQAGDIVVTTRPAPDDEPTESWRPTDVSLPVAIRIGTLDVDRFVVRDEATDSETFRLESLRFAGTFDDDALHVDTLSASGPQLRVDATGRLAPTGNWPLELAATAQLPLVGRPDLAVQIQLSGSVDRLGIDASAAAPYNARVGGFIESFGDPARARLDVRLDGLDLNTVAPGSTPLSIDATVLVDGWLDGADIDGATTVSLPDGPDVSLEIDARGTTTRIDVASLTARIGATGIDATGHLDLAARTPRIDLDGRWTALALPPGAGIDKAVFISPAGTFRIAGGPTRYDVVLDAALDVDDIDARLALDGFVDLDTSPPSFAADGEWRGVRLPFRDTLVVRSDTGRFTVSGDTDAWRFETGLDVDAGNYARGSLDARGQGNRFGAVLESFNAPLLGGTVRGQADVDWRDGIAVRSSLSTDRIDTARLDAMLAGQIGFDAELTATSTGQSTTASLSVRNLHGRLHESALSGRLDAGWADGIVTLDGVRLRAGDARLDANGRLGPRSTLEWTLVADDLGTLSAKLAGALSSQGRWRGNADAFDFDADIDAREIALPGATVGRIVGTVHAARGAERALAVDLAVAGIAAGAIDIDAGTVNVGGRVGDHQIRVALSAREASLNTTLAGGYADRAWTGRLATLTLEPANDPGTWSLDTAAALRLGAGGTVLERACLVRGDARACTAIDWRDDIRRADVTLALLPLADLSAMLPPGLRYEGTLSGELSLAPSGDVPAGSATLTLSAGQIEQRDAIDEESRVPLAWTGGDVRATLAEGALTAQAQFTLIDGGDLDFNARLPMRGFAPDRDAPFDARLVAALARFALLETLVPDLAAVRGDIDVDVTMTGTLNVPRFDGRAELTGGSAELPRLGLRVSDTRLSIRGDGRSLTLDGGATSGDGSIGFDGRFALGENGWSGAAKLNGEKFTAVSLPELTATISPALDVAIDGRSVTLGGELLVPSARIEPRDLAGTVQPSADAVIVGDARRASGREPWAVSAEVRLTLGNAVTVDAFGLTGRIDGRLVATDRPGRPTRASGELKIIDGTYEAYGQTLTVERGRLIFTGGPIGSPGIDIRATRTVDDISVGVDLRGQLGAPQTTLFSDPPLGQADTLSYLVLGRPIGSVGEDEQDALNRASVGLGLSGAELIAQQVGRRLGFDDVAIDDGGGDEADAALVIGKYLSPKLYVSYGLGLFESFNRALLRYQLTPNLSVQTEAGVEQSADIVYTLER